MKNKKKNLIGNLVANSKTAPQLFRDLNLNRLVYWINFRIKMKLFLKNLQINNFIIKINYSGMILLIKMKLINMSKIFKMTIVIGEDFRNIFLMTRIIVCGEIMALILMMLIKVNCLLVI